MGDFIMEGIGRISGGEFGTVKIEGVGNCSNPIKAESIYIEGVFNCSGEIDAGLLNCEGVANFKSSIRAKKINVEGVVNLDAFSKIEASEIICEGVIKAGGEISTDILNAEGCIDAAEIVGDRIRICSHNPKHKIANLFNRMRSKVRVIEATTIELYGVKSQTVNGRDIMIGANCVIDNIDCNGTLFIDETSTVRNITGEYTRRY